MKLSSAALLLLVAAGCSSESPFDADAGTTLVDTGSVTDLGTTPDAGSTVDAPAEVDVPPEPVDVGRPVDVPAEVARRIAERPYRLVVPDEVAATGAPLVILLHGYGTTGTVQDLYFGLSRATRARGILYAIPDGTLDASMRRFWNATEACCDFARAGIDDVGYLDAIIDDVSARHAVDPRRIFLVGHSNGGFMAHRMACERSGRIAAVVSLAGATFNTASQCAPTEPVAVLQVHGTSDGTIAYTGGTNGGFPYPGAVTSVSRWATLNRCAATRTMGDAIDIESNLPGAETRVERHDGCMGGAAELWTITNGVHAPALNSMWATRALDWLLAHPKPAR